MLRCGAGLRRGNFRIRAACARPANGGIRTACGAARQETASERQDIPRRVLSRRFFFAEGVVPSERFKDETFGKGRAREGRTLFKGFPLSHSVFRSPSPCGW